MITNIKKSVLSISCSKTKQYLRNNSTKYFVLLITFFLSIQILNSWTQIPGGHTDIKCVSWTDPMDTTRISTDSTWFSYAPGNNMRLFSRNYQSQIGQLFLYLEPGYGPGIYKTDMSGSVVYWGDGSSCGCDGSVSFTIVDTVNGSIEGTFNFEPACFFKPDFRRIIGTFKFGNPALKLSINEGQIIDMLSGESSTITLAVTSGELDTAIKGASVFYDSPFDENEDFTLIGTTDESGQIKYKITVPVDIKAGDYIFNFYSQKVGFSRSDTIGCTVHVGDNLNISITPDAPYVMDKNDTLNLSINIKNNKSEPIENTEITISDPIQFDGTPAPIGKTDAQGNINYRSITKEETILADYKLKISASNNDFPDIAQKEILIKVSSKLKVAIQPDTIPILKLKDTIYYKITVKESKDNLSSGAKIFVIDTLTGTNNSPIEIGTTNSEGKIEYRIIVPETAKQQMYDLHFWAEKDGYERSDTIRRKVNVSIPEECKQFGMLWFCTTAPKGWEPAEPNNPKSNSIKQEGKVLINNLLVFTGAMIIDTVKLSAKMEGELAIDDIPLPGGDIGKYTFYKGDFTVAIMGKSGGLTLLANAVLSFAPKLFGFEVKIDSMGLLGGRNAHGVELDISFKIPGITGSCGMAPNSQTSLSFRKVQISKTTGFQFDGMSVKDLGLYFPSFCLKDLKFDYERVEDVLTASSTIQLPFGNVGGAFQLKKGLLDSIAWRLQVKYPPLFVLGTSTVGLSGFFGHIDNITEPELEFKLGGIFQDIITPMFYSIDVSGTYKQPSTLGLAGEASLFKPPYNGQWQVVGSIEASYDFSAHMMEMKGNMKMGTADGENYLITGDAKLKMSNKNSQTKFAGSLNGTIKLPKFRDVYPWKWLNSMFPFPISATTWNRFAYGRSKVIYGTSKFSSASYGPYSMDYVINLDKEWGHEDFLWFKAEVGGDEPGIMKGKNIFNSYSLKKSSDKNNIILSEQNFDIEIPEGNELAVLNIKSITKAPYSSIKSPEGTIYSETNGDKTIALSYAPDSLESFWTLIQPTSGTWSLIVQNPAETDSLDTYFHKKQNEFQIDVTQEDRAITVNWDNQTVQPEDTVYIMLDNNTEDNDGFHIASAAAMDGFITILLFDSLPDCSYYIYGIVENENEQLVSYFDNPISNPKATLLPPKDIVAIYNPEEKQFEIGWIPSDEQAVIGYLIMIKTQEGKDSIIADVFKEQISTNIKYPEITEAEIFMKSYGENGLTGCISEPVIVSVDDKDIINRNNSKISIYPNPASTEIIVKMDCDEIQSSVITICDPLGKQMDCCYRINNNSEKIIIDISNLRNGIYFITIKQKDYIETQKISIVR